MVLIAGKGFIDEVNKMYKQMNYCRLFKASLDQGEITLANYMKLSQLLQSKDESNIDLAISIYGGLLKSHFDAEQKKSINEWSNAHPITKPDKWIL